MEYFAFGLIVLLALNIWATRRIVANEYQLSSRKTMLIAGVWIAPFIGALLIWEPRRPSFTPDAEQQDVDLLEPAPAFIVGSRDDEFNVQERLAFANGLPVMDWHALHEWNRVQEAAGDGAAKGTDNGRRAWLLHLRDALGPSFRLHESEHAYIVSSLEPALLRALARYVSTTRQRILGALAGIASFAEGEKSILLVMDSQEDYYRYVAIYYPAAGEFAFSGGMFIDAGCPHFVVVRAELSAIEPVIAHEMTHSALARLKLPKWLDEGIAVNTERKLALGHRSEHTPQELHRKHLAFWNAPRVQQFWSGRSFDRTDDGNLLSYELARILVEALARDWNAFTAFALTAKRDDAGVVAAQSTLGVDLGRCVAALLELQHDRGLTPAPLDWAQSVVE